MDLLDRLALFDTRDAVAVALLVSLWLLATVLVENPPKSRPSTSVLMARYRTRWMEHYVTRQPRVLDAQIITLLRQSAAFFASGSMIAIGGGAALLGNAERLRGVAQDLTEADTPLVVWEIKLLVILIFATNAFLKFVWAHRLFGYCAVLMAAVPDDPEDPEASRTARRAGELNVLAARSYTRGVRTIYFGMATGAWLIGPIALILASLFTMGVVMRREFGSQSRTALLDS
jgi:uncharacterized membrane protein